MLIEFSRYQYADCRKLNKIRTSLSTHSLSDKVSVCNRNSQVKGVFSVSFDLMKFLNEVDHCSALLLGDLKQVL